MRTIINMMVFGLVLILATHFVVGATDDVSDNVGVQELRSMLTTTMEQNRRLEQQNRRMQLIWKGLQQMCGALQFKPSDEDTSSDDDTSDVEAEIDGENNSNATFRITQITSSGLRKDGCLQLSARYQAPGQHTREWLQVQWKGLALRSSGTKEMTKVGKTERYYTTSVNMCNTTANQMHDAALRLYTANESISLMFNTSTILNNGSQDLPEMRTVMLSLETNHQAKANEDLNVTIVVNGSLHNPSVSRAMRLAEIYFQGVNTSSNPPVLFETLRHTNKIAFTATQRDNVTSNYVLGLKSDYIRYGGILNFRLPHQNPLYGFVTAMYFGKNIHILSPFSKKVVPTGTFGVYQLPKQSLIFEPSVSITCASMGWPRPDVTIVKRSKSGNELKMRTEVAMIQQYVSVRTLTLPANRRAVGLYVCRASQGNRTLETTTEAIVHVPVVFDDARTAVLKNTTRKTVISCKASGVPIPKLILRTPSGADLTALGRYKVLRPKARKSTARIIVTVSPVDKSLTYVVCSANQGETLIPSQRGIPVFPDGSNTTDYDFNSFY